jgi:AraC-like DNA-binding protein
VTNRNKIEHPSHWQLLAKEAQFSPAKLAALCGVSDRHLQRIFKRRFGCPPSKWLRALQCRIAQELIRQGHSNKAVAAELGFLRDAHFCREFKRHFGVSPQKFAGGGGVLNLTQDI